MTEEDKIDLIKRLLELRRQKKVGVILADGGGTIKISDSEWDPRRGNVRTFKPDQLKELVESLESQSPEKKPAVSETISGKTSKRRA